MAITDDLIHEIVVDVEERIIGRVANKIGSRRTDNTEAVLKFVEKAGGGNHLEIGVLFGGSAIAAALVKKHLGHSGMIFCVDPLNGFYNKDGSKGSVDNQSGENVTPTTLFKNIRKFGVEDQMMVMQAESVPCPKFTDIVFTTAYIDGEHRFGVPLKDWNCVKNLVTKYVMFDNCADTHPDVQEACRAAKNDPEWEEVYDRDITYVVRRING
jgi:hypothetical protein